MPSGELLRFMQPRNIWHSADNRVFRSLALVTVASTALSTPVDYIAALGRRHTLFTYSEVLTLHGHQEPRTWPMRLSARLWSCCQT